MTAANSTSESGKCLLIWETEGATLFSDFDNNESFFCEQVSFEVIFSFEKSEAIETWEFKHICSSGTSPSFFFLLATIEKRYWINN